MKMPIGNFAWIMDDACKKVFVDVGPNEAAEVKMATTNLLALIRSKSSLPPADICVDLTLVLPQLFVDLMSVRVAGRRGEWR